MLSPDSRGVGGVPQWTPGDVSLNLRLTPQPTATIQPKPPDHDPRVKHHSDALNEKHGAASGKRAGDQTHLTRMKRNTVAPRHGYRIRGVSSGP